MEPCRSCKRLAPGLSVRYEKALCGCRLRRRKTRRMSHASMDRRDRPANHRRSGRLCRSMPRRWVVERFFAWINRNRRLAKDAEATIDSARAFLYAAAIMLLVRRIARAS